MAFHIQLADGSTAPLVNACQWDQGDQLTARWLVVIEGVGNAFLTGQELGERLVEVK